MNDDKFIAVVKAPREYYSYTIRDSPIPGKYVLSVGKRTHSIVSSAIPVFSQSNLTLDEALELQKKWMEA